MSRLLSTIIALFSMVSAKSCPSRSFIEQSLLDAHIPGAVVIVVNASDILYQDSFGHQSLSPVKMIDVNKSVFVLASISKTFVAVAVMQLVESNQVDLDTDINQYLSSPNHRIFHPQFPSHAITLRQLLSHSASIGINQEIDRTLIQIGDIALTQMPLAETCFSYLKHNASNWLPKPPGTVTLYSNVGSGLAGLIVERVTEISYEHYVKEKILKPLGINIKKAAFQLSDIDNPEDLVKHYAFNDTYLEEWNQGWPQLNITKGPVPNWLSIPFYSVSLYPAGLLRMSAQSLSIFLRMFMNNGSPLVHSHSIDQMRKVVEGVVPYQVANSTNNSSLENSLSFGLGWYWQKLRNRRQYIGHTGSIPGATHSMFINEKNNVGVILLTSGDVYLHNHLSIKIQTTLENIQMALFDCFET